MEKYVNYEMCKKCGGVCCKENGCVYATKDFKSMDFSYLRDELEKGKISISGQPTKIAQDAWTYVPFLRARNKDADVVDLITRGGPCINLTETGCSLSEEERPTFGLLSKPVKIGGPCPASGNKSNWLEYSDVLEKLVKYYKNKDIIDIVVDEMSRQMVDIRRKMNNKIELSPMEDQNRFWYHKVMVNKAYYTPEEVKKLVLFK